MNSCVITSSELVFALERVARLATGRTPLPCLNTVRISAANNRITFEATDMNAWGKSSCGCVGDLEPVCVSPSALIMLAKNCAEPITLSVADAGWQKTADPKTGELVACAGSNRLKVLGYGVAHLACVPVDEFPTFPASNGRMQSVSAVDLSNCLKAVAWSALPDSSNDFMLTNVLVEMSAKELVCVAVDRVMAAKISKATICSDERFAFPSAQIPLLRECLACDGVTLSLTDNNLIAESESFTVAVRLAEGKYPNYKDSFNAEKQEVALVPTEELCGIIGTAIQLCTNPFKADIELEFSPIGIVVELKGDNNFKASLEGKFKTHSFIFDAKRLFKCLKSFSSYEIRFYTSDRGACFMSNGDYLVGLSPIKLNSKTETTQPK